MLIRLSKSAIISPNPHINLPHHASKSKASGECTYHYIILVLRIDRLIVRRYVNLIVWQLVFAEVFKEICVSWAVEVDVGI
jgi:hypothetical protein